MILAPLLFLPFAQINPIPEADRGSTLFHNCRSLVQFIDSPPGTDTDLRADQFCMSYLDGFLDAQRFVKTAPPFCFQQGSLQVVARIYVAYMQSHPKLFDQEKWIGVTQALADAYPCASGNPQSSQGPQP